jgi:hypothetical protein
MLLFKSASSAWRGSAPPPSTAPPPPPSTAPSAASATATAALAAAAALTLASACAPLPPALAFAPFADSPVEQGKKPLAFGPAKDGSVRACEGNLNPNCVSTASTNDLYSPPWRAPLSVQAAARALERAVPSADPTARLVQSIELPGSGNAYRAWQVAGLYGPDIFEVVVKPERAPRVASSAAIDGTAATATAAGSAQEEESALITYRSSATTAKYLYPFTIVLTDGDAQRKRVMAVRAAVNFPLVGCAYVECYDEGASSGDFPFSFRADMSEE